MEQQTYKLNDFAATFKKTEKNKKIEALKGIDLINELNKEIGFDQILLRTAYVAYPNKDQLQSKRSEQNCEAFFKYFHKNLQEIESKYLRDTNDAKLIDEAQLTNKNQYNFLLNKNSVSKFIRDEVAHYQKLMEKFLVSDNQNEDQKGIKTKNMHSFLIDLFNNKHIMIIRQNQDYLKHPAAEIQIDVGLHLLQYGKKFKEMSEEQAKQQYFISEEEILDFLTFWLKEEPKIFILYARTQQRLQQQSKMISNQSHLAAVIHPSRMSAEQIVKKTDQIELVKSEEVSKSQFTEKGRQTLPIPAKDKESQFIPPTHRSFPMKTEGSESKLLEQKASDDRPTKKQMTKEELLKREMKRLFEYGCKKRYNLNKNTTFEDISEESRTMNLSKFIYFCNFFEVNTLITRQLTIEYFKMHAINMRTLDFPRFEKVIEKMIAFDDKIIQNLLKRSTFQIKQKKNHINKDKKSQRGLSGYKFMLHPINGKDVSTIEKQLTYRKLEKLIIREQKQKLALNKREELEKPPQKTVSRVISSLSANKVSAVELEDIRDVAFNPEKLIFHNDNDKLWDAYEAKIWSKDQRSPSTLQSILSKRIERGNIVINKLNSQRSFIYDQ